MRNFFYRILAWVAAVPAVTWAAFHRRRIRQHGRGLVEEEKQFCKKIGIDRIDEVAIMTVDRMPDPIRWFRWPLNRLLGLFSVQLIEPIGLTLGHSIYVLKSYESDSLIRHELIHVLQVERSGSLSAFLAEYFYQCLLYSYHEAPWEEEARSEKPS